MIPTTDPDVPETTGGGARARPGDELPEAPFDDADSPEELAARWETLGPPPSGGVANLCASLVTAAAGVFGAAMSLSLGIGTPTQPESGFFPFCMAVVVTGLSIVQIVVGRRGGDGERFVRASWSPFFGFVSMLAFIALMPLIGFEIPGLLLSFVWMKLLGGETWRSAALGSVLVVAAFYAVFVLALGTQIPHLF